jgi:multidrug resistance efflux pump
MKGYRKISWILLLVTSILFSSGCSNMSSLFGRKAHLSASGVVEAVEVTISSQLSGRVAEVYVDKGDSVQKGDKLLRLEDDLLEEQRKQAVLALNSAKAGLTAAQSGLEMAKATLHSAEVESDTTISKAKVELLTAEQALDDLNKNIDLSRANAQQAIYNATQSVRDAQYQVDNFIIPSNQQGLDVMQAVTAMKEQLDKARQDFEPYKYLPSTDSLRKKYKEKLDEAQSDYDTAVRRLKYQTELEQAEALLAQALRELEKLENGPDPEEVAILESRISAAKLAPQQAEAVLQQARAGLSQAEATLEQGQTAVDLAQADLDIIDIQLEKLILRSAVVGVVMARDIQPGEIVQPGVVVMTIGQVNRLTVTVYIPEDRYGQISLGDHAQVTSDSFPGKRFDAIVERIADHAEYTPRNIQTKEDRATTVFAIELSLVNPEEELKPGMPVDVEF